MYIEDRRLSWAVSFTEISTKVQEGVYLLKKLTVSIRDISMSFALWAYGAGTHF